MGSFLDGLSTLWGGAGNAGAASSNAWNYGQYSPYTVNNPAGQISFNGTTANSSLSPLQQQLQGAFGGSIMGGLGGQYNPNTSFLPQQYQNIFNPQSFNAGVQNQFQNSVNGIMPFLQQANQSNLDNEFSKGTLASTAGAYQTAGQNMATGGILSNLQNQAFQNQLGLSNSQFGAANATANLGEQQAQFGPQFGLSKAQAGLSGLNSQNQNFLQMLQAGGNLGAQRSGANVAAATPGIETGFTQDQATSGLLSGLLFGGGSTGGLLNGLLGGGGSGGLGGLLGQAGSGVGKWLGSLFGGSSGTSDTSGNTPWAGTGSTGQFDYGNSGGGNSGTGYYNAPPDVTTGDGGTTTWWGDFNGAGGQAADGLKSIGVDPVSVGQSEQNAVDSGWNAIGKSNLGSEVSAGLGIATGLEKGGAQGYLSAGLNAGKLYNDVAGHSSAFNSALGTVGGALNIYNGITSGTPAGYASAAASAAGLGGQAGLFGAYSGAVAGAAGAVAPFIQTLIAMESPAVALKPQYWENATKTLQTDLQNMQSGKTSQYGVDPRSQFLSHAAEFLAMPQNQVPGTIQSLLEQGGLSWNGAAGAPGAAVASPKTSQGTKY